MSIVRYGSVYLESENIVEEFTALSPYEKSLVRASLWTARYQYG